MIAAQDARKLQVKIVLTYDKSGVEKGPHAEEESNLFSHDRYTT
jgi:hypothetical protein